MATDRKRKYRANMYSDPDLAGSEKDNPWLIFQLSSKVEKILGVITLIIIYFVIAIFSGTDLSVDAQKYLKGVGWGAVTYM